MKTDYIYDMPAGKEIDEMVAEKVMGWHKGHHYFPNEPYTDKEDDWLDTDGRYMHGIKMEDGWYEDDEDFHLLHWHPSQSILWAWEVVEKMHRRGYWLYVGVLSSYVYAIFSKESPFGYKAEAGVDEMPLAICRAALLAVMHELE